MHVFYTPDIQKSNELPEEEAQHCTRVLRLGIGDEITLTDGKGNFYKAEITVATNKRCFVTIKETIFQEPLWPCHLHIAMAPTKNMDRNEWFAEKATEIGFDELTFLNCRFSERKVIKTERIEKILVSAIKQSLKARLPKLNEMIEFDPFIRQEFKGQKFIAHCYEGEKPLLKDILKPGEDALVLIGPEGDFSEEEVKKAIDNGLIIASADRYVVEAGEKINVSFKSNCPSLKGKLLLNGKEVAEVSGDNINYTTIINEPGEKIFTLAYGNGKQTSVECLAVSNFDSLGQPPVSVHCRTPTVHQAR